MGGGRFCLPAEPVGMEPDPDGPEPTFETVLAVFNFGCYGAPIETPTIM